jgi:phospholipase C
MTIDIHRKVDTIVVVMLENRSFDHMLGYLSLTNGANRSDIDGITSLRRNAYINTSAGDTYRPYVKDEDSPLPADLPHGRALVDVQLKNVANPAPDDPLTMDGFVEAYRILIKSNRVPSWAEPMSLHDAPLMMDYFARRHMVCNRWFAALPTDTQPNRLMALSGFTEVDTTSPRLLTQRPLVYDWMNDNGVRWRVYRQGLPFEMLMPHLWTDIVDKSRFRSFRQLPVDVRDEADDTFPQVVFVEPSFDDSPINFGFPPNCDHPPLPIGPGEHFLRDVYMALAGNAARWAKTVLIVTFDEHGGFYDHVPPAPVVTPPPPGAQWRDPSPFLTTGVRVPGLIVSPLVTAGSVYDGVLDHTSILQFIAARFGNGEPYSAAVQDRRRQGIGNVADALNRDEPRTTIPWPPEDAVTVTTPLRQTKTPRTDLARAFAAAADELMTDPQLGTAARDAYPELALWETARPS